MGSPCLLQDGLVLLGGAQLDQRDTGYETLPGPCDGIRHRVAGDQDRGGMGELPSS